MIDDPPTEMKRIQTLNASRTGLDSDRVQRVHKPKANPFTKSLEKKSRPIKIDSLQWYERTGIFKPANFEWAAAPRE